MSRYAHPGCLSRSFSFDADRVQVPAEKNRGNAHAFRLEAPLVSPLLRTPTPSRLTTRENPNQPSKQKRSACYHSRNTQKRASPKAGQNGTNCPLRNRLQRAATRNERRCPTKVGLFHLVGTSHPSALTGPSSPPSGKKSLIIFFPSISGVCRRHGPGKRGGLRAGRVGSHDSARRTQKKSGNEPQNART